MARTRERTRSSAPHGAGRTKSAASIPVPKVLRRSVARIAVPTALAALGAGTFVTMAPPRYTGEAQLILENRDPADGSAVATQIGAMRSPELAREAVRRLKLTGNPSFDAGADEIGPVRQALILLGLVSNPLDKTAEDRAVETYLDRLRITPVGRSHIVTVAFEAADAALAADGANLASQLYVSSTGGKGETRAAWTAPDTTVAPLRRRVSEADAKVEAFRARHGLLGPPPPGQTSTAQQAAELSNQLAQARLQRADIAGRLAAIRELLKDGRALEVSDIASTDVLRRMIDNRIAIRAQLALESRTLLPAHPRIKALKAQLEDADAQIKVAAERAMRNLENEARVADTRVANLQAAVDGQPGAGRAGNDPIELRALEREAKGLREQLDAALGRVRDASAGDLDGAIPSGARILARAVPPALPSFPDAVPTVAYTTLAAFLLAVGGTLGRSVRPGRGAPPEAEIAIVSETVLAEPVVAERAPEPVTAVNPFLLPEPLPPVRAAGEAVAVPEPAPAEVIETPAEAVPAPAELAVMAAEPQRASFDLAPLVARLSRRAAPGRAGRTIVVVDGGMSATGELYSALANSLLRTGSVLTLDLGAPEGDGGETGFTDVVAGHADFAEAIQPDGPSGAHRVAGGLAGTETLFEEPRALAFTLEAMAEAYAWVICRLHHGPDASDLLALVSTISDTVVIASDADPADPALADLYAIATDAGAGQVLIAQDRPARADDGVLMERLAA